jgi:hypothetical protein
VLGPCEKHLGGGSNICLGARVAHSSSVILGNTCALLGYNSFLMCKAYFYLTELLYDLPRNWF